MLLKGRYRIRQTIGQGGMGSVYRAEDTHLGNRLVAIKELIYTELSAQEMHTSAEQFQREAHLLAGLQHPNLPNIYDYFEENSRWYLVMSFIAGETLESYQQKATHGQLPVREVIGIGIELCKVLEYLHSHHPPIIFRDLKPANIMRTSSGQLYLIDFGIARHFKPDQSRDTVSYGSAGFAPPEQYGRAQTTPRSDIYSLGATLYTLLSGYDPSLSPFRLPPLETLVSDVPPALVQLITQMLEMQEEKRPANVEAVRQMLQGIDTRVELPIAPPSPWASRQPIAPPSPWASRQPIAEYVPVGAHGQQQMLMPASTQAPVKSTGNGFLKALGFLGTLVSYGLLGFGILGSFMIFTASPNYAFFATELWVLAFFIIVGWILLRVSLWPFRKPTKRDAPVSFWRHAGTEGGIFLGGAMVLAGVVCTFFLIYTYYLVNHRGDVYSAGVGGSVLYATSGLYILLNSRLKPPRIDFSSQRQKAIALTGSLIGASFGVPGLLMTLSFAGGTMVPGVILLVIGVFLTFITRLRTK
ncbi:hypothetical protein KSZ_29100 [Dictyobacter formicarum]|uniref:non-specific serine/threonine protein kinase n=2 Tax=Dictyobacter formicarum TaxID=2778368 RepID=A0ABQ3VGQ9_9CHLR|nr:hypothetical protein KSZ_29100 [Dictyobacter formicarum]